MNEVTTQKSRLTAEQLDKAVKHFEAILKTNGINPKSKAAKTYAYAYLQGIAVASEMYLDILHPAIWIGLVRMDVNELKIEK